MTIISASYKTDIPAFYGDWFEDRLAEGFAEVRNPFNNAMSRVSLKREDVDGFVFWTRNIEPFRKRLDTLIAGEFLFYIQYTVTGYPRLFETSVPATKASVFQIKSLAQRYGKRCVVWRYDPILISSITPAPFHLRNFKKISDALCGSVDEVVVSFTQFYQKTKRNLKILSENEDVLFDNPEETEKLALLEQLRIIAAANDQYLSLCTQPELVQGDLRGASCISAERLGLRHSMKVQGNRKGCLCVASRDIGGYETCPHGCLYCYAVTNRETAKANFKTHQYQSSGLA